ncbi:MAG: hypothetical protein LQ349_005675 [Xanthoria aureola]|nr:MAG: hypothetical protein LQ349_005675 [Xanthoria aureola]
MITDRQKSADQQTAEDLIAVEHDPKLRLPTRKRRNRVESAKRAGRTDLCAMEMEFRLRKADELDQSEVERIADKTDILEWTPGAENHQADLNPRPSPNRTRAPTQDPEKDPSETPTDQSTVVIAKATTSQRKKKDTCEQETMHRAKHTRIYQQMPT